jgi:hypothetical protein
MAAAMNPKPVFPIMLALSGWLLGYQATAFADEVNATNHWSGAMNINFTNSDGSVTRQAAPVQGTNISEVLNVFGTNYEHFLSSLANKGRTNLSPTDEKFLSDRLTNKVATLELFTTVAKAEEFLLDLKHQGRLPGISKESHGDMTADLSFEDASNALERVRYPLSLIVNVVPSSDSLTNHYTVLKPSENSAWQLQRAWRTDSKGRVIMEWPINQP